MKINVKKYKNIDINDADFRRKGSNNEKYRRKILMAEKIKQLQNKEKIYQSTERGKKRERRF